MECVHISQSVLREVMDSVHNSLLPLHPGVFLWISCFKEPLMGLATRPIESDPSRCVPVLVDLFHEYLVDIPGPLIMLLLHYRTQIECHLRCDCYSGTQGPGHPAHNSMSS